MADPRSLRELEDPRSFIATWDKHFSGQIGGILMLGMRQPEGFLANKCLTKGVAEVEGLWRLTRLRLSVRPKGRHRLNTT